MVASVRELIQLLELDQVDADIMVAVAPSTTLQRVFGGQVLAQALAAAAKAVPEDRPPHSLHGYFLRPGDPSRPIVYLVERVRDGRSFSTRRVTARQHGRSIFHMTASFQVVEAGLEHQAAMPAAPPPSGLPTLRSRLIEQGRADAADEWGVLDVRYAAESPQVQQVWMRTTEPLPDDPLVHACVLAYASDLTLLGTALRPHGLDFDRDDLVSASIDHAMWFHRPFRADDWVLYDQDTPSTSGGRGLARGRLFTRDGDICATTVQEGLMRLTSGTSGPAAAPTAGKNGMATLTSSTIVGDHRVPTRHSTGGSR